MPFAITLRLDDEAAGIVDGLRARLTDADLILDATEPTYPPHVTIAIAAERPEAARLCALHKRLIPSAPIRVAIVGISLFAGTPVYCWLVPTPGAALLAANRAALDVLVGLTIDPHYGDSGWQPHVTLAVLSDSATAARAVAIVHPHLRPIGASLDRLELVSFPPSRIVWTELLG